MQVLDSVVLVPKTIFSSFKLRKTGGEGIETLPTGMGMQAKSMKVLTVYC